jgi:membrane associated rhomboid family serine protease
MASRNLFTDFKDIFNKKNNAIPQFITINVLVLIVLNIFNLSTLFETNNLVTQKLIDWFALSPSVNKILYKPWSIVTYAFMHQGLFHILFNMLWLYWFGQILAEFAGNAKVVGTYFMGAISGALFYIIGYYIFPLLHTSIDTAWCIGASASVTAIIVAAATLVPNYAISLMFIGSVRIKFIALFLVVMDLIFFTDGNIGGKLTHLGGAFYGYSYITLIRTKGFDISGVLYRLLQPLAFWNKKPSMKVVYKQPLSKTTVGISKNAAPSQVELDRILDKINLSGYDSLSAAEKEFLGKASGKK